MTNQPEVPKPLNQMGLSKNDLDSSDLNKPTSGIKQPKPEPFDTNRISRKKQETPQQLFTGHRVTQMSPNDYYKFVSHHINSTPEELMKHRQEKANEMSIGEMRKMMRNGKKFDTPYLELVDSSSDPTERRPHFQEGLHRMLAAGQEYGMDTKFPVYIGYEENPWNELDNMSMDNFLKYYDDTRLKKWKEQEELKKKKEQEELNETKKLVSQDLGIPLEKITQQDIDKWYKEMDDFFK